MSLPRPFWYLIFAKCTHQISIRCVKDLNFYVLHSCLSHHDLIFPTVNGKIHRLPPILCYAITGVIYLQKKEITIHVHHLTEILWYLNFKIRNQLQSKFVTIYLRNHQFLFKLASKFKSEFMPENNNWQKP